MKGKRIKFVPVKTKMIWKAIFFAQTMILDILKYLVWIMTIGRGYLNLNLIFSADCSKSWIKLLYSKAEDVGDLNGCWSASNLFM